MPRGRGTYVDEPRDKRHERPPATEGSDKSEYAPDEQATEHTQEPPD